MKSVLAKVQIQFDIFTKSKNSDEIQKEIQEALHHINNALQLARLDCNPSIFVNNIDKSDIEVADEENEDET